MIAPHGYWKIGPAGLEPSTRTRNRTKASVKIRRNPSGHQTDQVQKTKMQVNVKFGRRTHRFGFKRYSQYGA